MIHSLVVALLIAGAPDGGSGSPMFDKVITTKKDEIVKKVVEKKGPFTMAVLKAGNDLSKVFTEKLGIETKVVGTMISPKEGLEGPLSDVDMAIITFTNSKDTFALVFIGVEGKLQLLPRDFKSP